MTQSFSAVPTRANEATHAAAAAHARTWNAAKIRELTALGAVAFQFGLVILLIRTYSIEQKALLNLSILAYGAFLVHHFLPKQFRLPAFAATSLAGIVLVMGWTNAVWLTGIGLALIGLCHTPLPFRARVAAVLVVAALLAAAFAGRITTPVPAAVWPILGAMFMFRMMVYLYDLRHRTAPFSFWWSASYFFMIPNVCFTLFPVVDYRSFCRSHYNDDPVRIYQTGASWMFRGAIQLLLYRLIYQNFVVDPGTISTAAQAARYMLATYLLYLQVSGSFHFIIGLLHMFGFNLSESNHLYVLSSSFTDYWRRINIYWKDFILKLFFNPAYLRLNKKMSRNTALIWATAYAFFATWILHSYQWFWIRGQFPVTWQDVAFWGFLGFAVLMTMLHEARRTGTSRLRKTQHSLRSDLKLAICTIATFTILCVSWTIWTTDSFDTIAILWDSLSRPDWVSVAWILGGLATLGLAAILFGRTTRSQTDTATLGGRSAASPPFWRPAIRVALISMVLIYVGRDPASLSAFPTLAQTINNLRNHDRLNQRDAKMLERGYYDNLTDAARISPQLAELYTGKPADWNEDAGVVQTGGFPPYEMSPSTTVHYKGVSQTTNQWGMRDKEYPQTPSPGTFRIALLGSSHSKGSGVEDNQTYENLVEARLNRELGDSAQNRIEILNFSTGGYGPLCKLALLEKKVLAFMPDAVLYEGIDDFTWIVTEIANANEKEIDIPFDHVKQVVASTRLETKLTRVVAEHRLRPHAEELVAWVFDRFVGECRKNGIDPWVTFLPRPELRESDGKAIVRLTALAQKSGFAIVDMSRAYDEVKDLESLWIAKFDGHPNNRGHQLLAEQMYLGVKPLLPPEFRGDGLKGEN